LENVSGVGGRMKRSCSNRSEDTIVAVSTPPGEAGIGIVRMSGRDALRIAEKIFVSADKKKPSRFKTHTVHYGHVVDKGRVVDEVLLAVMRAPRTYTKEDIVEINCHGGMAPVKKTVGLAVKKGARPAEPGEFTKRAFLNGRLDLAQAEAVLDVIRARTDTGLRVSVGQLEGALSREINSAREEIIEIAADIEATIDFSEEDIDAGTRRSWIGKIKAAIQRLQALSDSYHNGAILKNGVTAVICGRTNVGKSSLMNLLLKKDRVIVTDIPGTTRDAVEDTVNINGIPARLVDTAGIRKSGGRLEKEGINKSRSYLSRADIILCMLDGSEKLKRDDIKLLEELDDKRAIIVINKCDLKVVLKKDKIRKIAKNNDIVKISCLTKMGIDRLEDKVYNKIWNGKVFSSNEPMLNNVRHKDAIDRSIASLSKALEVVRRGFSQEFLASDMRESASTLGEIVGKTYTEDILDVIFSKFCIGK
jgi:tRNA modification GTPase